TLDTVGLESLGNATPLQFLTCEDKIRFGRKPTSPADLRRQIECRHLTADTLRNRIANQGSAQFAKQMLLELQGTWPGIVETAPMQIHDNEPANCLTLVFSYQLHDCWKQDASKGLKFTVAEGFICRELGLANETKRETDVFLGRPRKVASCAWKCLADGQFSAGIGCTKRRE